MWDLPFIIVFVILIIILLFMTMQKQRDNRDKNQVVHVLVVATDADRADQVLASISTKKGYKVHIAGIGETWTGYEVKLRNTLATAKKLKPDDVLMHLDAYDTFVLADADEVLSKFKKFNSNIVVSTETNLAPVPEFDPIRKNMEHMYPTAPNRYRWINSGTYIGYAGAIVNLLSDMPSDFHCDLPNGVKMQYSDDQRCFHTVFLKNRERHRIRLDYNQDIFHCMWGSEPFSMKERLKSETGSTPCVIHGNGSTPLFTDAVKILKSQNK